VEAQDLHLGQGVADELDLPIGLDHHAPRREPAVGVHPVALTGLGALDEDLAGREHELEPRSHPRGLTEVGEGPVELGHGGGLARGVDERSLAGVVGEQLHHAGDHGRLEEASHDGEGAVDGGVIPILRMEDDGGVPVAGLVDQLDQIRGGTVQSPSRGAQPCDRIHDKLQVERRG
jgi:hypothetical protein